MIQQYRFTIEGNGANGQTFTLTGNIACEFHETLDHAMRQGFNDLTHGRAVFGKPGVGCRGPYDIHRLNIERIKQ